MRKEEWKVAFNKPPSPALRPAWWLQSEPCIPGVPVTPDAVRSKAWVQPGGLLTPWLTQMSLVLRWSHGFNRELLPAQIHLSSAFYYNPAAVSLVSWLVLGSGCSSSFLVAVRAAGVLL